jgi:hypothetical protein
MGETTMGKTTKQFIGIGVILLAMYNIVLFAIAGFADHEAPFWISYVFMLLAFGMAALTFIYLGKSGMILRDWLFGYPIIYHCAIYIAVEMVASVIFMLLEYDVEWVLPLVIQILLMGVYAVFMLSCFASKTAITQVGDKVEKKTRYIALLQAEVQVLCQKCEDPALKAELQKLAENIRFSDPMSNDALSDLESKLSEVIMACGEALDSGNLTLAAELQQKAAGMLVERNAKCKALK